jgi:hypothetical protein
MEGKRGGGGGGGRGGRRGEVNGYGGVKFVMAGYLGRRLVVRVSGWWWWISREESGVGD